MRQNSLKIIGIDPGFERCGFAVLNKPLRGREELLHSECLKTRASLSFTERLLIIGGRFKKLLSEHSPDTLSIEKLYFEKNQKTAMRVAEVRGTLLFLAAEANLEICEYTPLQVKVAVSGYGKSDKKQLAFMLEKLLQINKEVRHDDEYDAIALALTASVSLR